MGNLLAVYETGKTYIKTIIDGDKVYYAHGISLEDYKKTLPEGILIIPFDEAKDLIDQELEKIMKPWEKIGFTDWDQALTIMPPEKWISVNGVEIFRSPEYFINNITAHYAHIIKYKRNLYYRAYRRITTAYDVLADEVMAAAK